MLAFMITITLCKPQSMIPQSDFYYSTQPLPLTTETLFLGNLCNFECVFRVNFQHPVNNYFVNCSGWGVLLSEMLGNCIVGVRCQILVIENQHFPGTVLPRATFLLLPIVSTAQIGKNGPMGTWKLRRTVWIGFLPVTQACGK
jgi:hypothetical protein